MQGRIKGISGNTVMLELDDRIDFPPDEVVDVEIKKHYENRSLTANRYYWKLIRLLSEKIRISPARIHNLNLRSMWLSILKTKGDEPVMLLVSDTDKAEQEALEDNEDHIMPIPPDYLPAGFAPTITKESGKRFRWYCELRGSKNFNTAEMSRLIDMTIDLCEEQGIQTLTPNELAKLEGYEKYSYRHR